MKTRFSILDDEQELYDFKLIAISCHLKDYKLCWKLNLKLGVELNKAEKDIEIKTKQNSSLHAYFVYDNIDDYCTYYLIKNRSESFLIPEQANADYFLKLEGEIDELFVMKKLNEVPEILTTYSIDINTLKSKENLIF